MLICIEAACFDVVLKDAFCNDLVRWTAKSSSMVKACQEVNSQQGQAKSEQQWERVQLLMKKKIDGLSPDQILKSVTDAEWKEIEPLTFKEFNGYKYGPGSINKPTPLGLWTLNGFSHVHAYCYTLYICSAYCL